MTKGQRDTQKQQARDRKSEVKRRRGVGGHKEKKVDPD